MDKQKKSEYNRKYREKQKEKQKVIIEDPKKQEDILERKLTEKFDSFLKQKLLIEEQKKEESEDEMNTVETVDENDGELSYLTMEDIDKKLDEKLNFFLKKQSSTPQQVESKGYMKELLMGITIPILIPVVQKLVMSQLSNVMAPRVQQQPQPSQATARSSNNIDNLYFNTGY